MERAAKFLSLSEPNPRPAAERMAAKAPGRVRAGLAIGAGATSSLGDTIHDSPAMLAQRRQLRSAFGDAAQLAPSGSRATGQENSSGLPGSLRSGIESLSGVSMEGVTVHYNSSRPAQLDAAAYAQGKEIHLAPGQEQHLPHEAWHVAQQAQGRVSPTMRVNESVPVNDDERLEQEADAMGSRALRGGHAEAAFGAHGEAGEASPGPVQRRVHVWTDKGWDPGDTGREGQARFPLKPVGEDVFFNDVTGKSGKSAKEAAESLDTLAVKSGSVKTLMADGGSGLIAVDEIMKSSFSHEGMNQTISLGYFTFGKGKEKWKWDAGGDDINGGAWTDDVASFLEGFMIANGQMDYIRSRDWYIKGSHVVEIDVNYYINRAFNTAPPYWHKDTGGGNLFVNLIFTNSTPIVGTETTADLRPMGEVKKASLLANMPLGQVTEIEQARKGLRGHASAREISAGALPEMGYLSWVDELIWHSSPFMASRTKWTLPMAVNVMLNLVRPEPFFKQETATTYEAMVVIASTPGTKLSTRLRGDPSMMDEHLASLIWGEGYNLRGLDAAEVRADLLKVKWDTYKLNEVFGHEQDAADPRVKKPEGIAKPLNLVTPSGLGGRKRALSDAATRESLKKLIGDGKGRNFLRTWVRVIPRKK